MRLGQVRSGCQVTSDYFMLCQFMTGYFRLNLVRSDEFSLFHVRSCEVRRGKVTSFYVNLTRLSQVIYF
jgi:hypothetical protein